MTTTTDTALTQITVNPQDLTPGTKFYDNLGNPHTVLEVRDTVIYVADFAQTVHLTKVNRLA